LKNPVINNKLLLIFLNWKVKIDQIKTFMADTSNKTTQPKKTTANVYIYISQADLDAAFKQYFAEKSEARRLHEEYGAEFFLMVKLLDLC
jgi:hypothetical protein